MPNEYELHPFLAFPYRVFFDELLSKECTGIKIPNGSNPKDTLK